MNSVRIPLIAQSLLVLIVVLVLLPCIIAAKDKTALDEQLIQATEDCQLDQVKALLAKGADVNARSPNGCTPLFWASEKGRENIVKLLLDKGAHINAECMNGRTPLIGAARNGHLGLVKLLLS